MKKFLLLLSAVMLSGIAANAAVVACDTVNPYNNATWTTNFAGAGNGCVLGDKLFTNFAVVAGNPGVDTSLTFGTSFIPGGTGYSVNFTNTGGGGFATSFTIGYNVTICYSVAQAGCALSTPAVSTNIKITQVLAGLQANGSATATLTKNVTGDAAGSASAVSVGNVTTNTPLSNIQGTNLNIADVFTYTSGLVFNISNTYVQTDTSVPEPATLGVVGLALVGLGLLRRRS